MSRAVLDTDILSEFLRGRNANVLAHAQQHLQVAGPLAVSVVSVAEVVKGLHRIQAEARVAAFLAAVAGMDVLPLGQDDAVLTGRMLADLERTGQPIGIADTMVAATAVVHGMAVATGNARHFARIRDLGYAVRVEDWRASLAPDDGPPATAA